MTLSQDQEQPLRWIDSGSSSKNMPARLEQQQHHPLITTGIYIYIYIYIYICPEDEIELKEFPEREMVMIVLLFVT